MSCIVLEYSKCFLCMVTYLYILELDIGREVQWLNKGLHRPSLLKYLLFRLQRGWGKGQQKSDFAEAVRRSSNKNSEAGPFM